MRWCESCYEVCRSRGQRWDQLCAATVHVLYEYEATVCNKVLSDDRPRRFNDKPEFFEAVCISIVRELRLFTLYFVPMQLFDAACLSWHCVRWITVWDKDGAILGNSEENLENCQVIQWSCRYSKQVPPEDEELLNSVKSCAFLPPEPVLESSICRQRLNPTDRNLNTSTAIVWKLVFKMLGVWWFQGSVLRVHPRGIES